MGLFFPLLHIHTGRRESGGEAKHASTCLPVDCSARVSTLFRLSTSLLSAVLRFSTSPSLFHRRRRRRRRRRPKQKLARSLPGTVVFFDKFCPDLHRHGAGDSGDNGGDGLAAVTHPSEGGENAGEPSALSRRLLGSSPPTTMAAACRWCSRELGNAPVVVLSEEDESDDRVGGEDGSCAGEEEGGGEGMLPRVLGLRAFLWDFVRRAGAEEEEVEELARRGDLLRGVHLSSKASERSCGQHTRFVVVVVVGKR